MEAIAKLRADVSAGAVHPKQVKVDLAKRIVTDFHSADAAEQAATDFERVHVQRQAPETVSEVTARKGAAPAEAAPDSPEAAEIYESDTLSRILVKCKLAASGGDATRKIKQGAVKVDNEKVTEFAWKAPGPGAYLIQVGPRSFVRLIVPQ
jgi:tyrosyl-tRNA synthetase